MPWLKTLIEMLKNDKALRAALERGDKAAELMDKSAPYFADMRRISGITHMYFTRSDRVNLLRVHQPLYWLLINRPPKL